MPIERCALQTFSLGLIQKAMFGVELPHRHINRGNYCIHRCILSCIDFCRPLSDLSIDLRNGKPVTCSFGVAQLAAGESAERLVARADEALYRAKLNGRNRVELANSVAARKGIGSAA